MAEKTNTYALILSDQGRKIRDQCIRQLNNLEGPMIGGIPPLDDYRIEINRWMAKFNAATKEPADELKDIMNRAIGAALQYVGDNPDKNRNRMEGGMTQENWIEFNQSMGERQRELEEMYDPTGGKKNG